MRNRGILFFICLAVLVTSYGYGEQEETKQSITLSPIKQTGKWGYIDKSGNIVINGQFGGALSFSEGLAPASTGGKWGYIDKTGKYVIDPQFDLAYGFSEGFAPVKIGDN